MAPRIKKSPLQVGDEYSIKYGGNTHQAILSKFAKNKKDKTIATFRIGNLKTPNLEAEKLLKLGALFPNITLRSNLRFVVSENKVLTKLGLKGYALPA